MKKPLIIEIRNKTFQIDFVSNWFSVRYYEMKEEITKVQVAYYEVSAVADKLKDKTISADAATEIINKNGELIRSIGTREFFERRLSLVQEALESNNIPYDKTWWERRTNAEDIIRFLDSVYIQGCKSELDEEGGQSKKVENVKRAEKKNGSFGK